MPLSTSVNRHTKVNVGVNHSQLLSTVVPLSTNVNNGASQRGGCTCCTCLYLPSCSACTWACTCACTRAVLVPIQCCTCACTRPLLMRPCHRRPRGPPIGNKHPNAHTWLTSGAGASKKMQEKCMHACTIGKLEASAGLHQGARATILATMLHRLCCLCLPCTCPWYMASMGAVPGL